MTAATRSPARSSSAPTPTSTPSTSTIASRSPCPSCRRTSSGRALRSRRNPRRSSACWRVYSPKATHDPLFISNYVTINLLDRIKSTPGVGDATLWGPQDYAMRAWVKHGPLTGLDLTTGDVISAIQAQNVQAPVGRIGARPISDDQQLQLSIQTQGRLTTAEQFQNIVLRTNPDGSVLRLGDVARIELGAANLDRETRLNGGPASRGRDLSIARSQRDHDPEGGPVAYQLSWRRAFRKVWSGKSPTTRRLSSRRPSTRFRRRSSRPSCWS